MSMLYPTKEETERIYKETEAIEKQRQLIKKIGEQL